MSTARGHPPNRMKTCNTFQPHQYRGHTQEPEIKMVCSCKKSIGQRANLYGCLRDGKLIKADQVDDQDNDLKTESKKTKDTGCIKSG